MHSNVHCSIIYNSQDIESTYVSMDGWMNKESVVFIYTMKYCSDIKNEGNLAICNNVDGLRGHYTKWNKSERERQILYDLTYIQNLKTNSKTNKNELTDIENRLVVARGKG